MALEDSVNNLVTQTTALLNTVNVAKSTLDDSVASASASATAAAASYDQFDDRYLGPKSANPSLDNDNNALLEGAIYWNTTADEFRVWNGSTWQADTIVGGTVASLNTTGSLQEGSVDVVVQTDIGTAPNEIPLNQYLGALAYVDTEYPQVDIGTGITSGTGTICKANAGSVGGVYKMTVLIDLTGLNSGGTAGDIIGVDGTALPCYIARLPTMTVLGGRMTCLEAPAGGDDDIDLYSAAEGTGVEDGAITALTETQIINGGTQSAGTVTYFAADPSANHYFYLVGQSTSDATYTAGRFLIEVFGV